MNIIFGQEEAAKLDEKYIVLELDTVTIQSSAPMPVYCVVENMPLDELYKAEAMKKLHADLISHYHSRKWEFCDQAIEQLVGYWGGEIDSFYLDLQSRVRNYKENEPEENWTGIIAK